MLGKGWKVGALPGVLRDWESGSEAKEKQEGNMRLQDHEIHCCYISRP